MDPQQRQAPVAQPQQSSVQPPKNKTGLIIGLIAGGLLLIGGITVALILILGGPSQEDYETAKASVVKANTQLDTTSDAFSDVMSSSSSQIEQSIAEFKKTHTTYKEQVSEFEELKALGNSDVKQEYDAFIDKHNAYTKYTDSLISTLGDFAKTGEACSAEKARQINMSDPDKLLASYDLALGGCLKQLDTLAGSDVKLIADYATKLGTSYKKQRQLFSDLVDAYKARDRAKYDATISAISTQAQEFSGSDASVMVTNLKKEFQDKRPATELDRFLSSIDDELN